MEKINIAEILKNCPKGMELNCTMYENVTFEEVVGTIDCDGNEDVNIILLTHYNDGTDDAITLTNYGTYTYNETAKCVIFPKGKTTWEGFVPPCQFKDGDVIYTKTYDSKWISIFEKFDDDECKCYVNYCIDSDTYYDKIGGKKNPLCEINDIVEQRFATEEEKEKLFKAIKDNGYKWNAETKTLEKLIVPKFKVGDIVQDKNTNMIGIINLIINDEHEYQVALKNGGITYILFEFQDRWKLVPDKFDITTLKPFESRVLVRNSYNGFWQPTFWGIYEAEKTNEHQHRNYLTTKGFFRHCIPYNDDTKHLLGTTNDCDEYYKTW